MILQRKYPNIPKQMYHRQVPENKPRHGRQSGALHTKYLYIIHYKVIIPSSLSEIAKVNIILGEPRKVSAKPPYDSKASDPSRMGKIKSHFWLPCGSATPAEPRLPEIAADFQTFHQPQEIGGARVEMVPASSKPLLITSTDLFFNLYYTPLLAQRLQNCRVDF